MSSSFSQQSVKTRHVCASLDLQDPNRLLNLAKQLAPHVMGFKLHSDILKNVSPSFYTTLRGIARKHNVLLIEDYKFCDIGHIVQQQYAPYRHWADAVTVHVVAGPGTISALIEANPKLQIIVVASMSSKDTLTDDVYFQKAVAIGCQFPDNVIGFVTQKPLPPKAKAMGMLTFSPGIRLDAIQDTLDQQYRTPQQVIRDAATDVAIVGRGIVEAKDCVQAAKAYEAAFE